LRLLEEKYDHVQKSLEEEKSHSAQWKEKAKKTQHALRSAHQIIKLSEKKFAAKASQAPAHAPGTEPTADIAPQENFTIDAEDSRIHTVPVMTMGGPKEVFQLTPGKIKARCEDPKNLASGRDIFCHRHTGRGILQADRATHPKLKGILECGLGLRIADTDSRRSEERAMQAIVDSTIEQVIRAKAARAAEKSKANSDIAKMKELKTKHLKVEQAAKHAVEAMARDMGDFEMKQKKSEEEAGILRIQFRYMQLIEQKNKALDLLDEATDDDQEEKYEETATAADRAAEVITREISQADKRAFC
jgi:hypothetical protein